MKFPTALLNNNSARMPLTILGILMVIMTIAFTTHIDKMDREMAESLSEGNTVNNIDNAYMYACADLARIINYAGMDAMKQMGETPVIVIEPTSRYNLSTDGECSVAEFNHNWARGMIMYVMNRFIQTNYMYNSFDYRGLAVNVETLTDWKDINITYIYMGLDREVEIPGLGANETYVTYWRVSVPLNISIVDLETDEIVYQEDLRLGNLITCRYPMLELLTYEYEQRLDGADALMAETTTLAQIYTAGRGYTQYFYPKGPKNIVDNDHLSLIVNAALMLDQGLVFNSVDGASVIEYMMQVKKILYEEENVDLGDVVMGIELKNGSVEYDPKADAAQSTGDPQNATEAMEKGLNIDFNATPIMDFLNNDSIIGGSDVSKLIEMVIPQVYSTSLATGIERETSLDMGEHVGYETSYDVGEWGEPDSMEQIDLVPKDAHVPGNIYGEIWRVTWTREHVWQHAYEVEYTCLIPLPGGGFYVDTCYRTEYDYMTTIDTRVDIVTITLQAKENSFTNIDLNYAGTALSTRNDVVDVYSSGVVEYYSSYTDPGLEEAFFQYKGEVFDPNKWGYIKDRGLSGEIELRRYSPEPPGWVYSEARSTVDEISQQIKNDVHLDQQINYENYPNPADAMSATALDLVPKIEANQTRYVDKASYVDNGVYLSASAKVISQVREWYVDEVLYQVNKTYLGAAEMINEQIDNNFGDSADDVKDANKKGAGLLKSILRFPVGVTMTAEHAMENGTRFNPDEFAYWDENVTIGVDMEPDYLFAENEDDDKDLINLGVRNICLMGPKGVPVLPPPHYVVHFNSWLIDVEGRIDDFLIFDADNVCHPNPMFGHEWQVYRRMREFVYDTSDNMSQIGSNKPLEFKFTTGTFIIVLPGPRGVGDGLKLNEVSSQYGNILWK